MRVGILGSGFMGGKLGTIVARAGREACSATRGAGTNSIDWHATPKAKHAPVRRARPRRADAVLLAVHWSRIDDVLKQAGDLSGKVIVTCCLPMDAGNKELIIGITTSGAEELAKKVPRAHVAPAFNTVPSEVLFGVFESKGKETQPSLVCCGDHQSAKNVAAKLIHDAGF